MVPIFSQGHLPTSSPFKIPIKLTKDERLRVVHAAIGSYSGLLNKNIFINWPEQENISKPKRTGYYHHVIIYSIQAAASQDDGHTK